MTDGFDSGNNDSGSDGGGINPAWNDMLGALPEEYREAVIPHLKTWDSNFQTQVQKVHSEYEPYKEFQSQGISADDIRMGLGVVNAIRDNPEQVYNSLGQSYGFGTNVTDNTNGTDVNGSQGQGSNGQDFQIPEEFRTQLDALQRNQDTIAQIILEKRREEEAAQHDASLKNELEELRKTNGKFNEDYVLAMMSMGQNGQEAINSWNQAVEAEMVERNRPKPPRLLGSGNASGIPGDNQVDVRKLSDAQTRQLVAKYLEDSKRAQMNS